MPHKTDCMIFLMFFFILSVIGSVIFHKYLKTKARLQANLESKDLKEIMTALGPIKMKTLTISFIGPFVIFIVIFILLLFSLKEINSIVIDKEAKKTEYWTIEGSLANYQQIGSSSMIVSYFPPSPYYTPSGEGKFCIDKLSIESLDNMPTILISSLDGKSTPTTIEFKDPKKYSILGRKITIKEPIIFKKIEGRKCDDY